MSYFDLYYSANDATHPRNRPRDFQAAADPGAVSAAVAAATRRVLAAGLAARLREGGRRSGAGGASKPAPAAVSATVGTPGARVPTARKQAALAAYERLRDAHRANQARVAAHDPRVLVEVHNAAPSRPDRTCAWW